MYCRPIERAPLSGSAPNTEAAPGAAPGAVEDEGTEANTQARPRHQAHAARHHGPGHGHALAPAPRGQHSGLSVSFVIGMFCFIPIITCITEVTVNVNYDNVPYVRYSKFQI